MKNVRRLCWLPLALAHGQAAAHAPVPGIDGFFVGLLHPFSTPSQALLAAWLGAVALVMLALVYADPPPVT